MLSFRLTAEAEAIMRHPKCKDNNTGLWQFVEEEEFHALYAQSTLTETTSEQTIWLYCHPP